MPGSGFRKKMRGAGSGFQRNALVRIRIFSEPESEKLTKKDGGGGGLQDLPTWIEKELALQYTLIVDIIKFF